MSGVSAILMACDDGGRLDRQLQSIQQQTLAPAELVVVEDGSTSGAAEIVASFAAGAWFPVSLIRRSGGEGAAESIIAAAPLCTGRYIAVCDQDDEWHPDKLFRCVGALEREGALLCAHSATLIDRNANYVGFLSQGITRGNVYAPLKLPPFGSYASSSQVFRRDLLDLISQERPTGGGRSDFMMHERLVYFLATSLGVTVTLAQPLTAHRRDVAGAPPTRQGLAGWFGSRRQNQQDMLQQQKAAAEHRAVLMSDIANNSAGEFASQAEHARQYWQSLADMLSARVDLYDSSSLPARLARSRAVLSINGSKKHPAVKQTAVASEEQS